MYIYLQSIYSLCKTAESKNKIYAFDTTMVRGNVMIHKPNLTFHRNTEWMKMAAMPHYCLITPLCCCDLIQNRCVHIKITLM